MKIEPTHLHGERENDIWQTAYDCGKEAGARAVVDKIYRTLGLRALLDAGIVRWVEAEK